MTVEELANRMHLQEGTIRRWLKSGEGARLPAQAHAMPLIRMVRHPAVRMALERAYRDGNQQHFAGTLREVLKDAKLWRTEEEWLNQFPQHRGHEEV